MSDRPRRPARSATEHDRTHDAARSPVTQLSDAWTSWWSRVRVAPAFG